VVAYVLGFGGFGGLLRVLLLLLAVLLESSELETSQATQDLCSFLLDSGVIGVGEALRFGKNS